jgi:hypothetical protein
MNTFEERTLRLKQELRVTDDKDVAKALGLGVTNFSQRKVRNSFPELHLWAMVGKGASVDVAYVLTGKRTPKEAA